MRPTDTRTIANKAHWVWVRWLGPQRRILSLGEWIETIWGWIPAALESATRFWVVHASSGNKVCMGGWFVFSIENHPVHLGPVTFHLQIHVVEDAPFEVLLGRPFFDVLSCAEISTVGGRHEIRIKNPKDGTPYLFSTKPRLRRTSRFTNCPQNVFPAVVRNPSPCPPPREIAPLFSNAFETVSLSASPELEYAAYTLHGARTTLTRTF